MDILAILFATNLAREGFGTDHAAQVVANTLSAEANLTDVYEGELLTPFRKKFNSALLRYFGEAELRTWFRKASQYELSFREFLWTGIILPDDFDRAGYRIDHGEFHADQVRQPKAFVDCSLRLAEGPQGCRAVVLVEKPGKPWVVFGAGIRGEHNLETTIKFTPDFTSMTTFAPLTLLRSANTIHFKYCRADDPVEQPDQTLTAQSAEV
jgi:hypothetical protein